MIAKVRIAPVDQWCDAPRDAAKKDPAILKSQGVEVAIQTESMEEGSYNADECEGKRWLLSEEAASKLAEIVGFRPDAASTICEHMLEMD